MIPQNLPLSWTNTAYGPARWAGAIITLVDWVRPRYPTVTFLGGLGDQTHITEGNTSAHNPVTKDPVTGEGIVLAVDLGVSDGNLAPLFEIRSLIYAHPDDPRMVGQGYLSGPDDKANNWPFGTGWNGGNTDARHLHVNVSAKYFPFRPDGYQSSMDMTTPWDFMASEEDMTPAESQMLANCQSALQALQSQLLGPTTNGGRNTAYTTDLSYDAIKTIQAQVALLPASVVAALPTVGGGGVNEAALLAAIQALPAETVAALKEAL